MIIPNLSIICSANNGNKMVSKNQELPFKCNKILLEAYHFKIYRSIVSMIALTLKKTLFYNIWSQL